VLSLELRELVAGRLPFLTGCDLLVGHRWPPVGGSSRQRRQS
jgi:hypothetical protein